MRLTHVKNLNYFDYKGRYILKMSSSDEEEFEILDDTIEETAKVKKTGPYMSIYEYAALISAWTSRIANTGNATGYLDGEKDPAVTAKEEVDNHKATLIIRRKLPDGTTEDWRPKDMHFPRK